ncbi:hypothetical protein N7532_001023 [Penicillium argentinense]|uniref:Uncharacterized protein n=1 Tax=Penicillium argentinense TaxID=1131581 RepID=A0A9W9KM19_9EURO|nr:uncharacterized protein N7532_001023 [Penicillium argentinense]KAJ5110488.1 hypothetical protein N7532_001023 [Penicillium argentinense]
MPPWGIRRSWLSWMLFLFVSCILGLAEGYEMVDGSNWRVENGSVTAGFYRWVGSYYNGTTTIEFNPFAGLAANQSEQSHQDDCPELHGPRTIAKFDGRLAVTETAKKFGDDQNPLDFYLGLWNLGFNTSELVDTITFPSEKWSLSQLGTQGAPYNVSTTNFDHSYSRRLRFNMSDCYTGEERPYKGILISKAWTNLTTYGVPISMRNSSENWQYPDPVMNMQFDSGSANLTVTGYLEAQPGARYLSYWKPEYYIPGQIKMTFQGRVDNYHSDVLTSDSSTPTWRRTVRCGIGSSDEDVPNSTGKAGGSSARVIPGNLCLVSLVVAAGISIIYF